VVIERLAATGLSGDLRRRGDGTIPVLTPKDDASGTDWGKLDWWGYAQKGYEWWDKRQAEQKKQAEEEAKKPPAERTPPKADPVPPEDTRFKTAKRYTPPPAAPGRGPRFLIRTLELSGKGVGLPDESPFDITGFSLKGSNVCLTQLPDETMTLGGDFTTKTAGAVHLDLVRKPGDTGTVKLSGAGVPVQALADPKISGDTLAHYQPTGTADLICDATWTDGALTGLIDSTVHQLAIVPPAGDQTALQIDMVLSRMKDKPLRWPVKIGGTLGKPKITDSGVDDLLKGSVADAAKAAAVDEATKRANQLIEEQGKKNPEVQHAADQLRGLLPGQKKK
jgi:hypothetical protein